MLGHGVPSGGAGAERGAPRTTTPGVLCAPLRLLGDVGMRAGGPSGPELPLPWCPARRRRHGAARGGGAPQRAGPARPRGARLQGNDVTVTSSEDVTARGAEGAEGARGGEGLPGLRRGWGCPGAAGGRGPGSLLGRAGRERPPEPPRPARVGAQRGVRPARPGARGKVTAAAAAARPLVRGPDRPAGSGGDDTPAPAGGKVLQASLKFNLSVGAPLCASADRPIRS